MAPLKAYFDESITHELQGVTAIAGYVGADSVWSSIEGPWTQQLALYADKGVKTFHMTECCGADGYGQFALVDTFHRMSIIKNLSELLGRSDIQPIWSAVLTEDWQTIDDAEFLKKYPKPFYLCFDHIVYQLADWARRKANGERIDPMFAYSPEYAERMAEVGAAYSRQDWYKQALGPIAFGYPEQVIPLQAADMLVHEIAWHWDNQEYGPVPKRLEEVGYRRVFANATKFNGLNEGGCFDAGALGLAVERFKRTGRIL